MLLEKLKIFPEEIELRNQAAARYNDRLKGIVATPTVIDGGVSVWAQYTIETGDRDGLAAHLRAEGIPTAVYYPIPLHRQAPYARYPAPGGLPATEAAAEKVISLPMHAYLDEATQDRIVTAVRNFAKKNA